MPAKTENQAQAARMALAAKKGKISAHELKGAAMSMYKSMTTNQLEEFTRVGKK